MLKIITSRVLRPRRIKDDSERDSEFIKGVDSTSYFVMSDLVLSGSKIMSSITISFNSGIFV